MTGDDPAAEPTRRGFIQILGGAGLGALSGADVQPQVGGIETNPADTQPEDFDGPVGLLIGPESAKPRPGGAYLSRWDTYRFTYFDPNNGKKWYITNDLGGWSRMATEFTGPETQVGEVPVEDYGSFFNHHFARPNAPDDKNWEYTAADLTKQASEIELDAASTTLTTTQRGNYPPGGQAIPGVAWRVTGTPTGGSAEAGYYDGTDGFGVGEDATDSYVFISQAGTKKKVYRTDQGNGGWNEHQPDSRVWDTDSPVITRFPHLFYGGGDILVRALLHDADVSELTTLHRFTPDNVVDTLGLAAGPPIQQPNLPVRFETASLAGANLRANAAHYEVGQDQGETRVNGEHFSGVTVNNSGWTNLISWQKRTNWDPVNVRPLRITAFASSEDVKLELQLDSTLDSNASFSTPTHTSSDETAVEVDTAGGISSNGERRWPGYLAAGQGAQPGDVQAQTLTFNLPTGQIVTLAAQSISNTDATVSGAVAWEEYF